MASEHNYKKKQSNRQKVPYSKGPTEVWQGQGHQSKGRSKTRPLTKGEAALRKETRLFFSSTGAKGPKSDKQTGGHGSTNELKVLPVPVEEEEHPPYPMLSEDSLNIFPKHEFTSKFFID